MSGSSIGDILKKMSIMYDVEVREMTNEEWVQEKILTYNQTTGDLDKVDGYNCEICKNKGHKMVIGADGYEAYRPCKCQQIRATLRRARESGLGDVITEYTFDKFKTTEDWQQHIKRTAQEFCNDDTAKWFYIGGQVGSGKSHLCTAIAAHYIKKSCDVKYMVWAEEAKRLKALVNDVTYQELINSYKNVEVLYIDDFLKVKYGETPTAADINLAFEIVNHRLLEKDKITIISSEKMLDEIMEYDEATMSRIYQKTGKYKISIGKDRYKNYRLKDGITI